MKFKNDKQRKAVMSKYKSENYKGLDVKFEKMNNGYIGAKAPSRTDQFIGIGKGKTQAFIDAKKAIDNFKDINEKTPNRVIKSKPLSERAKQNMFYENVLLDSISNDDDSNFDSKPPKQKFEFLKERFDSEYGWAVERMGQQKALAEWYQGLAIDLPFYNDDIIKLAKKSGSLPQNATDKQEQRVIDNYWNFMAFKTIQAFNKYGVK